MLIDFSDLRNLRSSDAFFDFLVWRDKHTSLGKLDDSVRGSEKYPPSIELDDMQEQSKFNF